MTVQAGSLEVEGGITVNEPLTLHGTGVGDAGALVRIASGPSFATWTGAITLGSDTRIGVDSSQGLVLSGEIGGPGGLSKIGPGQLRLEGPPPTHTPVPWR